jgi:hypothetical protein
VAFEDLGLTSIVIAPSRPRSMQSASASVQRREVKGLDINTCDCACIRAVRLRDTMGAGYIGGGSIRGRDR